MIKLNVLERLQIDAVITVDFEITPLNDEMVELIKSAAGYDEMISTAADAVISLNRDRVAGDESAMRNLDALFSLVGNDETGILQQIGERTCKASGLDDFIAGVLKDEESARIVDGDNIQGNPTLEQLHNDVALANAV